MFTTLAKVALCGNATLASAFVLFNCRRWPEKCIRFQTPQRGAYGNKVLRSADGAGQRAGRPGIASRFRRPGSAFQRGPGDGICTHSPGSLLDEGARKEQPSRFPGLQITQLILLLAALKRLEGSALPQLDILPDCVRVVHWTRIVHPKVVIAIPVSLLVRS